MGHQPVFEGFLASAADAVWEGTEGVGTGHQDFLSHTDEQIGIGGQEGINEIKMLHHHTLTPVYCLHNGVRQLMGLGEAHFKANVHMVCMAVSYTHLDVYKRQAVQGSIHLAGREILRCTEQELRQIQGQDLAVVFQEPMTSMNPVMQAVSYTHLVPIVLFCCLDLFKEVGQCCPVHALQYSIVLVI